MCPYYLDGDRTTKWFGDNPLIATAPCGAIAVAAVQFSRIAGGELRRNLRSRSATCAGAASGGAGLSKLNSMPACARAPQEAAFARVAAGQVRSTC